MFSTGTTTIEKYDLRTNSWIQIGTMNGRRLQFGVAVIDNKLYIVGGRDGLKTSNTVECFNPVTKAWTVMPPMSTHRHGLGKDFLVFLRFLIYQLGVFIYVLILFTGQFIICVLIQYGCCTLCRRDADCQVVSGIS